MPMDQTGVPAEQIQDAEVLHDDPEPSQGLEVIQTAKDNTVPMYAQTARASAVCVECNKPRVIFSRTKLGQRKETLLATALSEYEYSCGSVLFPPSAPASLRNSVVVKEDLQCAMPVEVAYYGAELGRKDICSYCAQVNTTVDPDLKREYKTVLPICADCKAENKKNICAEAFW